MTRRTVILALGTMIGATAFVGALHTSWGRPLLAKIGGCPVGKASAAQIDRARRDAVALTRGASPAPAPAPAAGFALDASTPDDVRAWAAKKHVFCIEKREGMYLACKDVPLAALADRPGERGTADDVSFAFRPEGRALVNVTVTSYALSSAEAASRMKDATARLQSTVGAPAVASGDSTVENLASARYATATVAYRFSDFMAEATATSFGPRGVAVREHYVSARD